MEQLIDQLWNFVYQYGLEITMLAFVTIFIVGIVKISFKDYFTKINKNVKKAIYETVSVVLAYGLTIIWMYAKVNWLGINGEEFELITSLKSASATLLAVKVMYPVYENFGIRELFKMFGNFVVSLIKKEKEEKKEEIEVKEEEQQQQKIEINENQVNENNKQ